MYGVYGGYDFRGLKKRTRRALKEADDVANTRIARVIVPSARGGGEAATANRVALGDATNAARRVEAAPKAAAREIGAETRGKNDLLYIARALGDGLGGLGGLVALCEMSTPLSDALKAGDVVHGVDFKEIMSEIWQRVRLSATEETFLQWLASRAQTYAST